MSNIATAFAIAEACQEAVNDQETITSAMEMFRDLGVYPTEETVTALMKFAAHLTSASATRVVSVIMSESEFKSMMEDIKEMESLG